MFEIKTEDGVELKIVYKDVEEVMFEVGVEDDIICVYLDAQQAMDLALELLDLDDEMWEEERK